MNKQKMFLVFLMLLSLTKLVAQKGSDQLLKVVPPSPNVAALGKYGEVPVSLYTGIPNISIPLYNITDGSLDLPVSLNYHAGGVKVEEIASSVGLGWSLNAGGVVGRSVRGLPDEISDWAHQDSANSVENIMMSSNSSRIEQLAVDVDKGIRDGEADIYYYNFGELSGKFFYDQAGNVHMLPAKNVLITPLDNGWKIVGEDGRIYSFTKVEQVNSANCSSDQSTYSAWFITSIKSADGKREITFDYDKAIYTYETLTAQTKYFASDGSGGLCMTNRPPCIGTQNYNTHRLARINFSDGYVKFNYHNVRCDLMMDKSLDEIEVYTKGNDLLKRIKFNYAYFGDNVAGCNLLTQNLKRLKLVSLTEETASVQKPPYIFEYQESVPLPNRLSYSQDHWGYYNGKPNSDLIATFTTTLISGQLFTFQGADRRANPETSQAGILTGIKYPTGGETSFIYENNTVSDNRVENQTVEQVIHFGVSNQAVSRLPARYESDEIVIPEGGSQVQFNVSGLSNNLWFGCDVVHCYIIKDNDQTPFKEVSDSWDGATTSLTAGTYKLSLVNECSVNSIANFSVTLRAQIIIAKTMDSKPVGGLRIKRMEDRPGDGSSSVIKSYKYHSDNDSAHSTGVLVNFPDYGYDYRVKSYETGSNGGFKGPPLICNYRVRQSFSNYPLATTQGSYVGYGEVIVDEDDGESRYYFNAYSDLANTSFPFAPVENFDWTRGFLLRTKDFISKDGLLVLVKETMNVPTSFNQHSMYGIKTGRTEAEIFDGEAVPHIQVYPKFSFYQTMTEFYSLGQTKERIYDQKDPAKFIETVTEYTYSPKHLQLTNLKTVTSKSDRENVEEVVSNKRYPFDYIFSAPPSGAEALGIKNLQELHAANVVVEEYVVKQNRNIITDKVSDQRVVDGRITTFKPDTPYPDQLFKLDLGTSFPLTNFNNGSLLNNGAFLRNSDDRINKLYSPVVIFNSYDDHGNITTQQKANDVKKSYIWGYHSKYPVAEIVGEDYATVIANSNLDTTILQNPSVTDDEIRAELNKIRTKFPTALITTYTYKPLVGITSQTDINNRSTYYQYDSFGRLVLVRDNEKNILKRLCYNYNGQATNCSINVDIH